MAGNARQGTGAHSRRQCRCRRAAMKLLMIDSHDSFTWNLEHAFEQLGAGVEVALSDEIDIAGVERAAPSAVVLSSGSGGPDHHGATLEMTSALAGRLPQIGRASGT